MNILPVHTGTVKILSRYALDCPEIMVNRGEWCHVTLCIMGDMMGGGGYLVVLC